MPETEHLHYVRVIASGVIYCEATPLAELVEDPGELDLLARGYRWCTCYSPACPTGEGGHVPESQLTAISSEAFEHARWSGWQALSWA